MKQSARIYFVSKDHRDIYFQGHYHDKMYIGSQLVWEKLKGGEYIFDFRFDYYSEDDDFFLTAVGYPLDLNSSNSVSIPVKSVRMADVFGSDYRGGFSGNFFVTAGKSEYVFITEDDGTYTIRHFKGGKVTDTITFTVDSGEDYYYRDFHSWFSADGQYNFYLISKKSKDSGGYDYFVYTIKGSAYSKQTFTIDTFCDKEIFSQNGGNKRKYIYCYDAYYYDAEEESLILGLMCQSVHGEEVTVKDGLTVDYAQSAQYEGFVKLKGSSYEKLSEVANIYGYIFKGRTAILDKYFKVYFPRTYGNEPNNYEETELDYQQYMSFLISYFPTVNLKYIGDNIHIAGASGYDIVSGNFRRDEYYELDGEYFLTLAKPAFQNKFLTVVNYNNFPVKPKISLESVVNSARYGFENVSITPVYDPDTFIYNGFYCDKTETSFLDIPVKIYNNFYFQNYTSSGMVYRYKISADYEIDSDRKIIKDVRNNSPFDIGISFSGRDKLNIKTTPTGDDISSQEITFGGYAIPEYFYTLNNIKDVKQYNGNYYFYANSTVNLLNTGASIGLGYTTNIYIDTEDDLRKEAAADENS